MSALTDRITAVMQEHNATTRRVKHPWREGILLNVAACTGCEWTDEGPDEETHDLHVAERIAEALQLTEECGYQIEGDQPDEPDAWFPAADYRTSRPVTHRRWVSNWITEQEQR